MKRILSIALIVFLVFGLAGMAFATPYEAVPYAAEYYVPAQVDSAYTYPLAGAVIGLFNVGETEFTTEAAIAYTITGADGSFAFEDLHYGTFWLREIAAPGGYKLSEEVFLVTITYHGEVVTHEIVNIRIRGHVAGLKVNAADDRPLAGAVIGLFNAEEAVFTRETAIVTATSASDGRFSFTYLVYGTYLVREITPPDGFVLSEETFTITISEHEQIIEILIENEAVPRVTPTPEPAPRTGDEGGIAWGQLIIFGVLLVVALVAFIVLKLKGRNR